MITSAFANVLWSNAQDIHIKYLKIYKAQSK